MAPWFPPGMHIPIPLPKVGGNPCPSCAQPLHIRLGVVPIHVDNGPIGAAPAFIRRLPRNAPRNRLPVLVLLRRVPFRKGDSKAPYRKRLGNGDLMLWTFVVQSAPAHPAASPSGRCPLAQSPSPGRFRILNHSFLPAPGTNHRVRIRQDRVAPRCGPRQQRASAPALCRCSACNPRGCHSSAACRRRRAAGSSCHMRCASPCTARRRP